MQIPALSLHLIADGTDSDVSTLVREYRPTDRGMSEDFGHAVSTRAITLRYDQSIASIITSANEILVIATLDGQMDFTGRIVPGASLTSRGASLSQEPEVDDITIEADDLSYRFDRQITPDDNIALENYKVCNPLDPTKSIIHFLCSLVDANVAISENIDITIRGFSADQGSVGTILSTLLSEYGYSWRLDAFGRVILLRWMYDSPQPQAIIDENVMLGQLTAERLVIEADAVEVSWTALKERSRALLYMADLPYGDDNRRSGWPIQPGYLYPEESNTDETWWNYDDVSLTNRVDEHGRVKKETNYSGIVLTRNHYLEEKYDQGISREITIFHNKRARITYRCSASESKKLYYSNILADVVYRGAKSVERANIIADPKTVDQYDASYIHDSSSASKLCQARARRLKNAAWRYIFCSEISWPVGTIISIQDPYSGISAIAIIIERQPDLITNIIEYKAVGLSEATISVSTTSTSILPGPDKRSSVGIEGIADAIALASISLLLSSQNISRNRAGNLLPASITMTARRQDTLPYHGRIRISLSHDGQVYQDVYSSGADEASKTYTVPATMTVGTETHYVTSVRVQLYAAGGFETQLGTGLCSVSVDPSAAPIYWGVKPTPADWPTTNIEPGDYLLDGRAPASSGEPQGGVMRQWTGTGWVEFTDSMAGYADARARALLDVVKWAADQGQTTLAAAVAVINSLWAYDVSVGRSLRAGGRYSITGAVENAAATGVFQDSNGTFKAGSPKGEFIVDAATGGITIDSMDMSLKGAFLATKIGDDELSHERIKLTAYNKNKPAARLGSLDYLPGLNGLLLKDNYAEVAGQLSSWSSETSLITDSLSMVVVAALGDGKICILYRLASTPNVYYERILERDKTLSAERYAFTSSDTPVVNEMKNGELLAVRVAGNAIYERRRTIEGVWGDETSASTIDINAIATWRGISIGHDQLVFIVQDNLFIQHMMFRDDEGKYSRISLEVAGGVVDIHPLDDGRILCAYRDHSNNKLYSRIVNTNKSLTSPVLIADSASSVNGSMLRLLDGSILLRFKNFSSPYYRYQALYKNGNWSTPLSVGADASYLRRMFRLHSGEIIEIVWRHDQRLSFVTANDGQYARVGTGIIESNTNEEYTFGNGLMVHWGQEERYSFRNFYRHFGDYAGLSSRYIHMKTNALAPLNGIIPMWRLHAHGHVYGAGAVINAYHVGYWYGPNFTSNVPSGTHTIFAYRSTDGYLVFSIYIPSSMYYTGFLLDVEGAQQGVGITKITAVTHTTSQTGAF